MTKKKDDGDKVDKKVISEDDPSFTESFAGDAMESIDDLLGLKSLSPNENVALVRIAGSRINSALVKTLKLNKPQGYAPMVAGPFKLSDLEAWGEEGTLVSSDLIQVAYRRWLPASECFAVFQKPEMTATMEMTSSYSLSGTNTVEMSEEESGNGNTPSGQHSAPEELSLELEDVVTKTPPLMPEGRVSKNQTYTQVVTSPLRAESKPATVATPTTPTTLRPSVHRPKPNRSSAVWIMAAVFLLVLFFSVKSLIRGPKDESQGPSAAQNTISTPSQNLDLSAEWPEWMRALSAEALLSSDDAIMMRLAPIIERVRYGSYDINESEIQTLRRLSNPATASWSARKTASNILAVWMGLQGTEQTQQAIDVLQPIYEASPDDYVTVVNLAMLTMNAGNLNGADELAQVGLRLCGQSTCWFSNLIMASVKQRLGQMANAEKFFQQAADDFSEPVAVFSAWAQMLLKEEPTRHSTKAKAMMERALWGDPDRFLLSPLPDATRFSLLYQKLYEQIPAMLAQPSLALSTGQQEFLKWRLAFLSGKSSIRGLSAALNGLSAETAPLSQLLSAYLLSLKGDLDAARERLASMLVMIKDSQPSQGWPWTLAGDLQAERGFADQALVFYQSALNRSARDRGAVYGLGLLLRRRGDYLGARQKFGEAMAMDSQFVLPKLRVTRFDWQRRLRDK